MNDVHSLDITTKAAVLLEALPTYSVFGGDFRREIWRCFYGRCQSEVRSRVATDIAFLHAGIKILWFTAEVRRSHGHLRRLKCPHILSTDYGSLMRQQSKWLKKRSTSQSIRTSALLTRKNARALDIPDVICSCVRKRNLSGRHRSGPRLCRRDPHG